MNDTILSCFLILLKDEGIIAAQKRCCPTLLQHLVKEIISSNTVVREQVRNTDNIVY